jgi:hypothetical protein
LVPKSAGAIKGLKVYHGVVYMRRGEYIPFTDADPFALS